MPMDESITEEFPILKGPDDRIVARLRKARKRLQGVFAFLDLTNDVIIVCGTALEHQNVECDSDVANILRRHVSNPLFVQMRTLHKVVVKLGGVTLFSEEAEVNQGVSNAITA
jgi:hypothetical protein